MRHGLPHLSHRTAACVVFFVVLAVAGAVAAEPVDGLVLADRVSVTDRDDVAAAVAEIERAPATTPNLDEALRKAARACEDVLADPARALALYERILREFPNTAASRLARARAELLRARVGAGNAHAREAAELATLLTSADELPAAEVERRAEALARTAWPGAPDATLFLAEWLQRTRRFADAQRRYAELEARWPGTPQAIAALRGAAGCALEMRDWELAEALARRLPILEDTDRVLREEILARIARGRTLDRWYVASWFALTAALLVLLASFAAAVLHGGRRWPPRRPPAEVLFLLPVAAVLFAVALTTHRAIAPAVFIVSGGGIVLAWLSGVTLDLLRTRRHAVGLRAALHVVVCLVGVAALTYIVLVQDDLLDMMIETIKFGPDP